MALWLLAAAVFATQSCLLLLFLVEHFLYEVVIAVCQQHREVVHDVVAEDGVAAVRTT